MVRLSTQREIAAVAFALLALIGGFSLLSNVWGG